MNRKSVFLIKCTFIFIFFLTAFLYLNYVVQPELLYFAQQPAFQANKYFFIPFLTSPGGLTEYLSLFLSQSFYYNWPGAIILTLTLLCFLFLGYKILENITQAGNAFFLMFLPVILLLALLGNYSFPFLPVLNVLLVYCAVFISGKMLKETNRKWYLYFLIAPIIYYLGGSGSFVLYSSSFLILLLCFSNLKKSILPAIVIILTVALLPYIVFKYLSNISFSEVYFDYYLNDNLLLRPYEKNIFFFCFFYSLPVLLLLLSLVSHLRIKRALKISTGTQKKKASKKVFLQWYFERKQKYGLFAIIFLICVITILSVISNTSKHQNNIVKADFFCANEKWNKAISVISSDREYDILFNFYYNRAIDNSGKYLDKYFNYPQLIGSSGTFPDELNYEMLYFYYSDYYFDLGYISESQQWAFRILSGLPYCPRILKHLVITNLILGDYKSAGKFLSILGDNLLSKDFVSKYAALIKDTTLISGDKIIIEKRSLMPVNRITPFGITERFKNLLDTNRKNKKAYEHMQMNFLLNHQYGAFYRNLPQAADYYKSLPRVFEEALLITRTNMDRDTSNFQISPATMNSFMGFSDIYSKVRQNNNSAQSYLNAYKNTFFYYIMFDSPLVTKNAPVKMSESEYNH